VSNCKIKVFLPLFIIILTIGPLSACINKEEASVVEKYKLKEEEIKFKGYLSPIQTKTLDLEESKLLVKNGDQVVAGDMLTKIDDKTKAELDGLEKKLQRIEAELGSFDKNISEIKKGNYSISSDLSTEVETLKESIQSQDYVIQELELNLEEIKFSYETEKNNFNRKLSQNKTDINSLNSRLEKLKSSSQDANLIAEEVTGINNEVKLLDRECKELEASLATLEQTYKYNESRTRQTLQNTISTKGTYEEKYQNILKGNSQDPSVKAAIQQFEEEKKVIQENLDEIKKERDTLREESQIFAPFDGQIIVSDGNVVIQGSKYQFIFDATEKQMDEVKQLDSLQLEYKSKIIGKLAYHSSKYNEEISVKGQVPYYSMVFEIDSNSDYKPMRNATAFMVYKKGITIPDEYLGKNKEQYYVLIKGKQKAVKIEKLDKQYILIDGAKKGDVLEKVVNG
jgi:multidrug efflux pump subunit AcrA (membrane-fusion protein)